MKTLIALFFILSASLSLAEEAPALSFPSSEIVIPPLLFADEAKQGLPLIFGDVSFYLRAPEQPPTVSRRLVSHMPIVVPTRSVDVRMPIKTPDESIDYKMVVKAPDLESVK